MSSKKGINILYYTVICTLKNFQCAFEDNLLKEKQENKTQSSFKKEVRGRLPGLDGQLGVENAGRNAELFQEQLESVASVHRSHKHQRLALNQPQPQQRVDEQELVLLLTLDAVLLQLTAARELRALKLQDHLREHRPRREDEIRPNNTERTKSLMSDCSFYYGECPQEVLVQVTLPGCEAAAPLRPERPQWK